MTALIIVLSILAVLLVFIIAASLWTYFKVYYYANKKDVTKEILHGPEFDAFADDALELIETALKIPFEEVTVKAFDGVTLYGRIYHKREGAPFHIQFNGYRGNGMRDFCLGMQLALSAGDNVLLVDQRSHGKSGGHTICYGVKERRDVISWINYVNGRFGTGTPVFLEGVSMGAATVLMSAELGLPANVKGILADCPYSSPYKIINTVAERSVKYAAVAKPFIVLSSILFGHFNVLSASAEKAAGKLKVPCLLIHGTADNFVPFEMSLDIRNANPDMIRLVEFEGAPHAHSYFTDKEKYTSVVKEFWDGLRA